MTLTAAIQSIIDASHTDMGVSIHHLESGEEININADVSYPMCSVLKIPVLCEAFRQIHAGQFTLDDRWPTNMAEKNIGSGILTYLEDGLNPTARDLLTLMIIISDNTATDMVIHRVGVANIDAFMKELGVADIHMAMDIRGIFDDMMGPEWSHPARYLIDLNKPRAAPPTNRDGRAYSTGPDNNVSTPRAMTQLLTMIAKGQVVDEASCGEMLHILLQQHLKRAAAALPALWHSLRAQNGHAGRHPQRCGHPLRRGEVARGGDGLYPVGDGRSGRGQGRRGSPHSGD